MPVAKLSDAKPLQAPATGGVANLSDATAISSEPGNQPSEPEGFFHSLGSSLGITPEAGDEMRAHPVAGALKGLIGGPALPAMQGLYQGAKRSGGELLAAGKDALAGNGAGVAYHGVKSIPFVGPGMDKAADQYAGGDKAGELGTLTGTAAQVAPMLLGGVDAAASDRPLVGQIPSKARAGELFNSLNKELENHEVPLSSATQPLQRVAEIGARGGTLPKAASDLLTRSQAISPMTFPEARDYQGSLSDLSASDKMSMNGRIKGGVSQLSKGLYDDIKGAADRAGLGSDYEQAMREYRQAATIQDGLKVLAKYGIGAGLGAAGATGAYHVARSLMGGR